LSTNHKSFSTLANNDTSSIKLCL